MGMADDHEALLKEARRQTKDMRARKRIAAEQRGQRLGALAFQLNNERQALRVLRTRAQVRNERPSGARWEDGLRKVAELESEIERLEAEGKEESLAEIHAAMKRSKKEWQRERIRAAREKRQQQRDHRRRTALQRSVDEMRTKHAKPWNKSVNTRDQLPIKTKPVEPNPNGKPFDMDENSLWPVLPPRSKVPPSHGPWRAVPGGKDFGGPPEHLLPESRRNAIRETLRRREVAWAETDERAKTEAIIGKARRPEKQPWKCAVSAACGAQLLCHEQNAAVGAH